MSMPNQGADLERISDGLARMHIQGRVLGFDLLQGGISGSYTYRVRLDSGAEISGADISGPAILKVTLANSEPYVLDRARREFEFYHTLAGQIPLRTPPVLASVQDPASGTYLLLAALEPVQPPRAWQAADFASVAEELAALHARFWGDVNELSRYSWLRQPVGDTSPAEIDAAQAAWQSLGEQHKLGDVLTAPVRRSLSQWVAHISTVDAMLAAFPLTLCHGDCHIGNLLRDAQGNRVWADWQEVGVGRGPEDLSFLLQRAYHDGNEVPWERTVASYQQHLQANVGEPVPLAAIQRTMEASELRTELAQWPFYLQWATVDQVSRMVHRMESLVNRLELE
jgi:thiamine kinase-like enzyme